MARGHTGLVVLMTALGPVLLASASTVTVQFDRPEAHPGETVRLLVSGTADPPADTVIFALSMTTPGSLPEPAPGPTWNDSSSWSPPWNAGPGDTNADGTVDFKDYLTLKSHLGMSGQTWEDGDFDADGDVDRDDLLSLQVNFGVYQRFAVVSQDNDVLLCQAFGWNRTFGSGLIATLDMVIPDDGSYTGGEVLGISVDTAQFASLGIPEVLLPGNLGSDDLLIVVDVPPALDASLDTIQTAPEPATMLLLAPAACLLLRRRKRQGEELL